MAEQEKRKKDTGHKTILSPRHAVRTLALKFYAEQVPGWQVPGNKPEAPIMCGNVDESACAANYAMAEQAKAVLTENIAAIDKSEMQVIGIMHYRDLVTDEKNFWSPPTEKPHFHVIVRIMDGKVMKVSTILNKLGVKYRQGTDDLLWINDGVETVRKFPNYAMYLTHETEQSKLDGKEQYGLDELFSNLTIDEIKEVQNGYVDPSKVKVKVKDMAELDKTAYQLGYDLKDFNEWYRALPFEVRAHSKMKTVEESYYRGVDARIAEHEPMVRCCIYIQGEKNTGKTTAAESALKNLGKKFLSVNGGGTGKFDGLRPDHGAIVIDDDVCPNLLNMSDNRICRAYKRQKNNPAWTGKYLIVTSNKDFDTWLEECRLSDANKHAARSRFFICHVEKDEDGVDQLVMGGYSDRGGLEGQNERLNMYLGFKSKFNDSMREYSLKKKEMAEHPIDYEYWDGKYFRANHEEQRIIHGLYVELQWCLASLGISSGMPLEKRCEFRHEGGMPPAGDPLLGATTDRWGGVCQQWDRELTGAYWRNDCIDVNYVREHFEAMQAEYEEAVSMVTEWRKEQA